MFKATRRRQTYSSYLLYTEEYNLHYYSNIYTYSTYQHKLYYLLPTRGLRPRRPPPWERLAGPEPPCTCRLSRRQPSGTGSSRRTTRRVCVRNAHEICASNECRRSGDGDGEENDINGVIHTVKSQNCFPTPRRNVNLSTIAGESRSLFKNQKENLPTISIGEGVRLQSKTNSYLTQKIEVQMYRNRGPFPGFEQRSSSEAITHMIEPPALPLDARTSANAQHTHLSPQLLSLFLAVPPSSFVLYPCTTLFNRNVSLKKRIFQSPAGKPAGKDETGKIITSRRRGRVRQDHLSANLRSASLGIKYRNSHIAISSVGPPFFPLKMETAVLHGRLPRHFSERVCKIGSKLAARERNRHSIDNVEAINRNPTVRREESIRNRGPRILWKFISRIDRPLTGGFANDAIPFYSRIRGARRLRQFAIGHGARECRPITDSISRAEADHHDHLHAWGHIRYGKAFFPYSIARIEKGPARSIVSARSHDGHGSAGRPPCEIRTSRVWESGPMRVPLSVRYWSRRPSVDIPLWGLSPMSRAAYGYGYLIRMTMGRIRQTPATGKNNMEKISFNYWDEGSKEQVVPQGWVGIVHGPLQNFRRAAPASDRRLHFDETSSVSRHLLLCLAEERLAVYHSANSALSFEPQDLNEMKRHQHNSGE
ncbi:unnamed protein product [Nesidiocoris tenuis]|uniref:Uncharacterized protein n=1 Tax=Nesidiocoris tenuis TaxID=355587 RepID=A0A6H5GFG0_9HEMI|nr:unnamed protein product [Nesidiocoris tenuis]